MHCASSSGKLRSRSEQSFSVTCRIKHLGALTNRAIMNCLLLKCLIHLLMFFTSAITLYLDLFHAAHRQTTSTCSMSVTPSPHVLFTTKRRRPKSRTPRQEPLVPFPVLFRPTALFSKDLVRKRTTQAFGLV